MKTLAPNDAAALKGTDAPNSKVEPVKRKRKKPGQRPVVDGEPTKRVMTNLNASLYKLAEKRAGKDGLSAYIRDLIKIDLEAS